MGSNRWAAVLWVLVLSLEFSACGGGGGGSTTSNNTPPPSNNPVPAIQSVSPSSIATGSSTTTVTVTGSNFMQGSTVMWNGTALTTAFVSSTKLTATIPASALSGNAGNIPVTVSNPTPGGGTSNSVQFSLQTPTIVLSRITPQSAVAGGGATLIINGTGFVDGANILLNGQPLVTTFGESTEVFASIPTTLSPGNFAVTVTNPAPNPGLSNTLSLSLVAAGQGISLIQTSIDPAGNSVSYPPNLQGTLSSTARYFAFGNYLRDTCIGASNGCVPTTISFADGPGIDIARSVGALTPDGQHVVSSLIPTVAPIPQGDLEFSTTCIGISTGCNPSTQILTLQDLLAIGSITGDGRFVSYEYGPRQPWSSSYSVSAYLYDTCTGVSSGCTAGEIAIDAANTSIGDTAVMGSTARYVVYAEEVGTSSAIVLRDTCIGAPSGCTPNSQILSDTAENCGFLSVSGDGQWVTYSCVINGSSWQVFLENTCAGQTNCTPTTTQPNASAGAVYAIGVSNGGRYLTYYGTSAALANYFMPNQIVYVYDTCNGAPSGCTPQTAPVCVNAQGAIADAFCTGGQISDDGKYIYFNSQATNLASLPAGVTGASYIAPNPLQ